MKTISSTANDVPIFSIIIPTYNSERTILDCLKSVACQSLQSIEVIVQDGLSSDNTLNIISNFNRTNHSLLVRVFSEADLGVYDAMNKALPHANGMWIYFLGSDDKLFDSTTLQAVSNVINDKVDVIYGDVIKASFGGRWAGRCSSNFMLHQNICHQSIFIRSSTFIRLGYFDISFKVAADWEHNLRWFLDHTINVIYIDEVIAIFADGGLSSTNADFYFDSQKSFLYAYHGRKTLPVRTKVTLVLNRFLQAVRRRNLRDIWTSFKISVYLLVPPKNLAR